MNNEFISAGNYIRDAGASAIAAALEKNEVLTSIDLESESCLISPRQAGACVRVCQRITCLNVLHALTFGSGLRFWWPALSETAHCWYCYVSVSDTAGLADHQHLLI